MRIDFDLDATPEYSSGSALLPPGRYLVAITREQDAPTRSGRGRALRLTYEVLDGACKGQTFGENVNYQNENPTTVSIARSQLKSIGLACRKPRFADTMELHRVPFFVETTQDESADGKKYTSVKAYAPRDSQAAQASPQQPQQYQQPPHAAAIDAPFWGGQ